MKLPEEARGAFKEPLGRLIPDSMVTKDKILDEVGKRPVIITVGDATSERVLGFGLVPLLEIIDGRERRASRDIPDRDPEALKRCRNPPGEISAECEEILRECLKSGIPTRLIVDGEEDLLVLPACLHAPDGAVILYGQPNEGMVVVHVDGKRRDKARSLLSIMR